MGQKHRKHVIQLQQRCIFAKLAKPRSEASLKASFLFHILQFAPRGAFIYLEQHGRSSSNIVQPDSALTREKPKQARVML